MTTASEPAPEAAGREPSETAAGESTPDRPPPHTRAAEASPDSTVPRPHRKPRGPKKDHNPPYDPTSPIGEQYRYVMRRLPQPPVICSALHPGEVPEPHAMTVSSLTSLSIDPSPLLCFNIKKPSRTLDAISAAGRFSVHILADTKKGQGAAQWFSRPAEKQFERALRACGARGEVGDGVAELSGRGILWVMRCRVAGLVNVRDHVVVVGEVERVRQVTEVSGSGLVYTRGRYRRVGEEVDQQFTRR